MSTKTNFKRIALVAVAALGLGVLSSVPANAAIGTTVTLTSVNGTATTATSDSTTSGSARVLFLQSGIGATNGSAGDSVVVSAALKSIPTGASMTNVSVRLILSDTGTGGISSNVDTDTSRAVNGFSRPSRSVVTGSSTLGTTGYSSAADPVGQSLFIQTQVDSTAVGYSSANYEVFLETTGAGALTAGTYVISVVATPHDLGVATSSQAKTVDISIVVSALASAALPAVPTGSTAVLYAGTSFVANNTVDSSITALGTASVTAVGVIRVVLLNAAGTTGARESVTVTTSLGTVGAGGAYGRSVTLAYSTTSLDIDVRPDGSAGVATINISTPSVTFASKTVSFYASKPATLVASVATPNLKVGSQNDVIRVTAKDAAGINWAGTLYSYASTAADGLIAGSATVPVACTWDAADGRHECPVTGNLAGTAKMKVFNYATAALGAAADLVTAGSTVTSNEVSVKVNTNTAATVKISFDKATYAPNERARIYVTPLDSAGLPIATNTFTNIFGTGGIQTDAAFTYAGSTTVATDLALVSVTTAGNSSAATGAQAGSALYTVFMPAAGGKVTLTALGGGLLPAAGQVTVTATATVTDSGAAALAAVTALATTVASLKTLITTLTNLVLKIQKKVKA